MRPSMSPFSPRAAAVSGPEVWNRNFTPHWLACEATRTGNALSALVSDTCRRLERRSVSCDFSVHSPYAQQNALKSAPCGLTFTSVNTPATKALLAWGARGASLHHFKYKYTWISFPIFLAIGEKFVFPILRTQKLSQRHFLPPPPPVPPPAFWHWEQILNVCE